MDNVQQSAGCLEIDLGALAHNWRLLAASAHPATCSAVIKANGYGLGLEQVMGALIKAGCHTFFVAHMSEAKRARAVCDRSIIYVLNGLMVDTIPLYVDLNVRPVIGSMDEWHEWHAYIASCQKDTHPLAALHIDTGMNRLGITVEQAREISAATTHHLSIFSLVMSHLRSAEDWHDAITLQQIADFEIMHRLFPQVPASLSNSSGIFRNEKPFYDMVRAGYALYGGNPTPHLPNPMAHVITLKARIVQVRDVRKGDRVGYNGTWQAQKDGNLAVLSVGYADGYPRAASASDDKREHHVPVGYAIIAGVKCPFAGRVSMDLLTVDVSDVPQSAIKRGDWATLIGEGLYLDRRAHV